MVCGVLDKSVTVTLARVYVTTPDNDNPNERGTLYSLYPDPNVEHNHARDAGSWWGQQQQQHVLNQGSVVPR